MSAGAEAQYVTFGVGAETFAAPVSLVREILDYREAFRIPNGPAYLLGLTDVRGRGVPTVDLRVRLGLPAAAPTLQTRIIVLDAPLQDRVLSLGLVADRVHEVIAIQSDQIEPAPEIGVPWRSEYIAGVVRREQGFVVLIDIARLFTSREAAGLESAAEQTFAA
ncbi:MAG: chemotaxis protein CheW [Phenylobacterium sp.]|uniref:chemotaxis protein CheW n=1 Tax=Phenylobacterium sp. TaxID=1871053 RepID=UPI00391BA2E9